MASGSARVSAGCKGGKSSTSPLPIFVLIARFQVVNRRHAGGRNRYKDALVARVSHRQVVGGERPAEFSSFLPPACLRFTHQPQGSGQKQNRAQQQIGDARSGTDARILLLNGT